ncbi:MAG: cellulase family glycosylhydrolase [Candidatus Thorarchaeota archaeon]
MKIQGHWFIDEEGRKILLRGVNLGGSSKIPAIPDGATHIRTDFRDHREVSFVNRPFPLNKAEEHFTRLKHWGFNCIRFLITWEAIEHSGPEQYDKDYLEYVEELLSMAGDYDFYIFIDPHQDVWARMSGGDGAPGWTFETAGLDFTKFEETNAAHLMQYRFPDRYKAMSWVSNYNLFATATMFSLFFAGSSFTPRLRVQGDNIQRYLQQHFIQSIVQLVKRCKDMNHIFGWEALNEPSRGFIGNPNLNRLPDLVIPGLAPTAYEAMITAGGHSREISVYGRRRLGIGEVRKEIVNPDNVSVWLQGRKDIWQEEGIWEERNDGTPRLLNPTFFTTHDGIQIHFFENFLKPFIREFTDAVGAIIPDSLILINREVLKPDELVWEDSDPKNVVNAPHWYNGFTLFTKKFNPWVNIDVSTQRPIFLPHNVRKMYLNGLKSLKEISKRIHNGVPTLLGEFGVPFDLQNKQAYRTGNYKRHVQALTMYYDAIDRLLLHSTIWNYTSDNSNEWGDRWNLEDLSIFSRDQQNHPDNINSGGRAIIGFCRPYVQRTAGTPLEMSFNQKKGIFNYVFTSNGHSKLVTEIFIPRIQYPNGFKAQTSEGEYSIDNSGQLMQLVTKRKGKVKVTIFRRSN